MTDKNLWGETDSFADVPKFLQPKVTFDGTSADVIASDVITLAGHPFENGDKVKYVSTAAATNLASGTDYFVVARTADTFKLEASVGGGAITLTNDGAAGDSLQIVAGDADKGEGEAFFIDVMEAGGVRDQGLGTAGWNTYYTYTAANGDTRHKAENIVAMGKLASVAGDSDSIGTVSAGTIVQPTQVGSDGATITMAQGSSQTFTVDATNDNADAVFTFEWNTDIDPSGNTSYAPVTEANTPGAVISDSGRSLTINVPNDTTFNGKIFRCAITTNYPGGETSHLQFSHSFVLSVS